MDCIFFLNKKFAFTDAVTRATGFHRGETRRRQRQPAIRRHIRAMRIIITITHYVPKHIVVPCTG